MPIVEASTFKHPARASRFRALAPSEVEFGKSKNRFVRQPKTRAFYWSQSLGLSSINKASQGRVLNELRRLAKDSQKSVVVEWGCGTGSAIRTASKLFPSIKFIGFSKTMYPGWEKRVSKNASFLSTGPNQFVTYLCKKKITPSLIFDSMGLFHLIYSGENISHLTALKDCLSVGGKVISIPSPIGLLPGNKEKLEAAGFAIESFSGVLKGKTASGVVLTRVK